MKRMLNALLLATAAAGVPVCGMAQQSVELDTDAAHVIVVRPVDFWSGDASVQEETLDAIRSRQVSYDIMLDGTRYRGSPLVLQGVSDNPVTLGAQAALAAQNTTLVRKSAYLFHVGDATTLAPDDYPKFAKAQLDYRQLFLHREGDPRTREGPQHCGRRVVDRRALHSGAWPRYSCRRSGHGEFGHCRGSWQGAPPRTRRIGPCSPAGARHQCIPADRRTAR